MDQLPGEQAALAEALLQWFDQRKRDLPWRQPEQRSDPYAVLVAEVMLQQTRVETVVPYYRTWLERFPTVEALARAPRDEVLSLWEGLGYYNRARWLHRAAERIVDDHGGRVPGDLDTLMELPGIGPYTGAAVAAMAFEAPTPAVDGNVARVTARLCGRDVDAADPGARAWARTLLEPLLEGAERRGDLAEALIELGATTCTPTAPACTACPLADPCQARASGEPGAIAGPTRRGSTPVRDVVALLVRRGPGTLLRRRPPGLLGGLWGLPMTELAQDEAPKEGARRLVGGPVALGREVAAVTHTFTHKRWHVAVHEATLDQVPTGDGWGWVAPDEERPRSRLDEKVAEALAQTSLAEWA